MISEFIVWGSLALAAIFTGAWALSPGLRRWIERPGYLFLEAVQSYDRGAPRSGEDRETRMP